MAKEPLLVVRPSGWNFFGFWAAGVLLLALIIALWQWVGHWPWLLVLPLVPWGIALWKRASLELRVYEDRVVLETGVLTKDLKELYVEDIRAVEIRETLSQRLAGIGSINIASAGEASSVITAKGIPHPRQLHDLLQELRKKAKATVDE